MKIAHTFEYKCESERLYQAIARPTDVAKWWTDDVTFDQKASSIATFRWRKFGWAVQMRLKRLEPNSMIEWECISSNMQNTDAWQGSKLTFQITQTAGKTTRLAFLHDDYKSSPCYDECNAGWAFVLGNSLKSYIENGTGKPFENGSPGETK